MRGFLAHGHGRCSYHLTTRERLHVLAVIRAEREMRELRDVPHEPEHDEQPEGDHPADEVAGFDVGRFAGAELDE